MSGSEGHKGNATYCFFAMNRVRMFPMFAVPWSVRVAPESYES